MKKTKKEYLIQFIRYYHKDCAGIANIVDKLVESGEVLTTDTAVNILGAGYLSNFIECSIYPDGVGLSKWEFNQLFWESHIWKGFIEARMDKLIERRNQLNDDINALLQVINP